jgi:glycosyltransferase involved in cell wall biosynthesis
VRLTFVLPNIEISGGNRATFELSNELVLAGHQVTILYPTIPGRNGQNWWNIKKTAIQLIKGAMNCRKVMNWFPLKADLRRVSDFSDKELPEADYLIATWWCHAEIIMSAERSKGDKIHFVRSLEYWGGPHDLVTKAYLLPIPKVTVSRSLQVELVNRFGIRPPLIIPDAVNSKQFYRLGESKNYPTIGMMYRRQPLKRMIDGLVVMGKIATDYPSTNFILFGESILLRHIVLIKKIPNLKIFWLPSNDDLNRIYNMLDIFLFTSGNEEAFGMPPMEAMACGCAVVSSDVGAISSYIEHGVNGLLYEAGNTEELYLNAKALLDSCELLTALSERAPIDVKSRTWQASAQIFSESLEKSNFKDLNYVVQNERSL